MKPGIRDAPASESGACGPAPVRARARRAHTSMPSSTTLSKGSKGAPPGSVESARGEMVLVIDRNVIQSAGEANDAVADLATLVEKFENEGMDHRAALKKAARELGLSRDEAYRRLVAERGQD